MSRIKSIPFRLYQKRASKLGQSPGTLTAFDDKPDVPTRITLVNYDRATCDEHQVKTVSELRELNDRSNNTWVNVEGITDTNLVAEIGRALDIHALVLEDILNPRQRIKIEVYDDYLFIVLKLITYSDKNDSFGKENVSLILGKDYLISFQEGSGAVFDVIRDRLRKENSRMRTSGCDYLAYSLIDLIVDHYYVVVDKYGEQIERLELALGEESNAALLQDMRALKRELLLLLRAVSPLGEVLNRVMRDDVALISGDTRVYFRDVNDHFMQVKDTVNSFRDLAADMLDGYLSMMSHRMNEVMKVLTIFAAIFIPLTFIAGVYGMNFEFMPELKLRFMYPLVWLLMMSVTISMLVYFKRKKWF